MAASSRASPTFIGGPSQAAAGSVRISHNAQGEQAVPSRSSAMLKFADQLQRKLRLLEASEHSQRLLYRIEDCLDACVAAVLDRCTGPIEEHLGGVHVIQIFRDRPIVELLPVVAVGTIMGTLYVTFSWAFIPAVGLSATSTSSVIFHSSFILAGLSYERGLTVDPGRIPDDWQKDEDGKPLFERNGSRWIFINERKRKGGALRFCNKEQKFKPDRAHFCSAMQRNVLRMDHYCPWLVNCVGHHNHKYFILFLFYTVLASITVDAQAIPALCFRTFSGGHTFMIVQGTIISSLLTGVLGPFFGFHCWLMANNMTTIEFCEKKRDREASPNPARSPYDIGLYKNIQCIMGDQWPLWFLPISGPAGDGLQWGIAEVKQAPGAREDSAAPQVAAAPAVEESSSRCSVSEIGDYHAWLAAGSFGLEALTRATPSFWGNAWQGLQEIGEDIQSGLRKQGPNFMRVCFGRSRAEPMTHLAQGTS
eukprot:TRINITY_DN58588_c0_g1_i1.p1 TRINITY_DN58588_c0_g1~~TRINITY_DN58588_c0_g1_i1.p1  ORF type:complete len:478 (-),score=66.08 TRINITY_DN58588_c0_g1_i1:56-1489(-)